MKRVSRFAKVNGAVELRARAVAERALVSGCERVLIVYEKDERAKVYAASPSGTPRKFEVSR